MLLEPLILLVAQVGLFGANHGIIKLIAKDNISYIDATKYFEKFIRLSVIFVAVISATIFYYKKSDFIVSIIFGGWAVSEGALLFLLSAARGANFKSVYIKTVWIKSIFILSILIFIFSFDLKFDYFVIPLVWALASIIAVFSFLILIRGSNKFTKISNPGEIRGFYYGVPIFISAVIAAIIGNIDRYMLSIYGSMAEVGAYAMMVKLVSAMTLVTAPISLWWPTVRFKNIDNDDNGQDYFSKMTNRLIALFGFSAAGIWLSAPFLIQVLAPGVDYSPSIFLGLLLSVYFYAIAIPINIGSMKDGKTHWIPFILVISLCVQFLITLSVVEKWGGEGVAWATAFTAFLNFSLQFFVSQNIHHINFDYKKILIINSYILMSLVFCNLLIVNSIFSALVFIFLSMIFYLKAKKSFFKL